MRECSQFVHNMKVLDTNQSWELFMKKAFINNTDGNCPEELQNIGEEILKWCSGLPLAISVVGGLLQKKTACKSEWEKVVKEMKSHLNRSEDINTISAILELSYQNLPPELKACFLSLGFFKEDAVIKVKNLVHIWVAQGLVAQEVVGEEETMEDVATDYLNQLISRNMVQVKNSTYDLVKACHMHDLLHDLSLRKAKEEINLEVLIREEGDPYHSLHKPRHRAIYYRGTRFVSFATRNQYLRSLFIHGEIKDSDDGVPSSYWKSFELLRLLDLRNAELKVLPQAIGVLTGLRYFKMRYRGETSKLPRSWAKLTNLLVLDLWGGFGCIIIDKVILKMDSLRHLYVHISSDSEVPLGYMRNLQTLRWFHLKDSGVGQIQGLMGGVSKLGFDMSEMSDASELFTFLARLGNLVCLSLKHNSRAQNMDGLGALQRITKLKLDNFYGMKRLPPNFPPNLSYLTLGRMPLIQDPMPVLERLPELLYLKLWYAYTGAEMVISGHGFPRLKVLRLRNIEGLRNVQVEKGGMPELQQLFIRECSQLNIENLPQHLRSAITDD